MIKNSLVQPSVSVIIPANNSGEPIEECLRSIKSQNYPLYEIIVVDNFSIDSSARALILKRIQHRCNSAQARNIGVDNSTGKYVLFLDSDQVMSSTVVRECVDRCENEKIGMAVIPEVFSGKGFWSSCSAA